MTKAFSPRSFRLACRNRHVPLVEELLRAQGFVFEAEEFYPLARRQTGGGLPLGSSLAAAFGYIYIQDRSSMLPPLALNPGKGSAALDMCASPGSKTSLLACMTGGSGFTLGNEPSPKRLSSLRRNLKLMNLFSASTCSWPGEQLPLPDATAQGGGWEHILLDPPCSGWGTVEKHPKALRLWQGDKLKVLVGLQRLLLKKAARLLAPGGKLAYSTCTTNISENEEQARFAVEELGLELQPLGALPGFSFAPPAMPGCEGVWRVETGPEAQGFFVTLLSKPGSAGKGGTEERSASTGPSWDCERIPREALDSEGLDAALLPPGDAALFGSAVYFLPEKAGGLLPGAFAWKGFPLGRLDKSGRLRSDPWLRGLMPPVEEAKKRGLACLEADDPGPALALMSGQSLRVDAKGPEMGLYFRGLPLCRLTVKGGRAMLPRG